MVSLDFILFNKQITMALIRLRILELRVESTYLMQYIVTRKQKQIKWTGDENGFKLTDSQY